MEFIKFLPSEEQTCGAAAGVFCSFVGNPLDVLKVRVQVASAAAAEHLTLKQSSSSRSSASSGAGAAASGVDAESVSSGTRAAGRPWGHGLRKRRQMLRSHPEHPGTFSGASSSTASTSSAGATSSTSGAAKPQRPHFSIARVFRMTRQEPLTVWYSGWTSAATSAVIENSVLFLAKAQIGKAVNTLRGTNEYTVGSSLLVGSLSGVFSATAITPTEVIKIRLMTQNQLGQKKKYHGIFDCLRKIVRNEGWPAMMSGWTSTLLRDIPFTGSFFGSYEVTCWALHRLFHENTENRSIHSLKTDLNSWELMFAGGVAGCVGWTVMMPMDTVKSSLQRGPTSTVAAAAEGSRRHHLHHRYPAAGASAAYGAHTQSHLHSLRLRQILLGDQSSSSDSSSSDKKHQAPKPKRTFLSVSRMIWQQQGYRGFYRGLSLALVRSFPANAALFLAYENCHRSLTSMNAELAALEGEDEDAGSIF